MDRFSEKSLLELGEYYVYGLVDPRTNKIFYIGKGTGNRVFQHEQESISNPDSEKLKLKKISEIKNEGFEVKKLIINSNLTEEEAFAAEASLINVFNYITGDGLTNIVAGHHSTGALTVEEFEATYGAEDLTESEINHEIMVIKINQLYRRGMSEEELYEIVRGIWRASLTRARAVDYVFGVYNSIILAVYKPTEWYKCKDKTDSLPKHLTKEEYEGNESFSERIFFIDKNFESHVPMDEFASFYVGKSINQLKINQSAQNPITYLKNEVG